MNTITLEKYREIFKFPVKDYYLELGFNLEKEPYEIPSMEFIKLYDKNKYRPFLFKGIIEVLSLVQSLNSYNYLLSGIYF